MQLGEIKEMKKVTLDARQGHGYKLTILTPKGGARHPEIITFFSNGEITSTSIDRLQKIIQEREEIISLLKRDLRLEKNKTSRMRKKRKSRKKSSTLLKY